MELIFFSEDCKFTVENNAKYERWIASTAKNEGADVDALNIIFCSDNYILKINREYLQHDYFTDIITFDYGATDDQGRFISGDLFISVDTIHTNADAFGVRFREELDRVIIHGVLHLLGYQDKDVDQQRVIREKEDYYLSQREAFLESV